MRGYERRRFEGGGPPWTPSLEFCAQSAHLFAGWAVVLTASAWLGPWVASALFVFAYAFPKEALVDPLMEGDDWYPDGAVDFAFYLAGAVLGACFALGRT